MKMKELAWKMRSILASIKDEELSQMPENESAYLRILMFELLNISDCYKDSNAEVRCEPKNPFYKFLLDAKDLLVILQEKHFLSSDTSDTKKILHRDWILKTLIAELYQVKYSCTLTNSNEMENALIPQERDDVPVNHIPLITMGMIADLMIHYEQVLPKDDITFIPAVYFASEIETHEIISFLNHQYLLSKANNTVTSKELNRLNNLLAGCIAPLTNTVASLKNAPYSKGSKLIRGLAKFMFIADAAANFNRYNSENEIVNCPAPKVEPGVDPLAEYIKKGQRYQEVSLSIKVANSTDGTSTFDLNKLILDPQDFMANRIKTFKSLEMYSDDISKQVGTVKYMLFGDNQKFPAAKWAASQVLYSEKLDQIFARIPTDFEKSINNKNDRLYHFVNKCKESGDLEVKQKRLTTKYTP